MNNYNKTDSSPNADGQNSRYIESCLFLLIILIETGIFLYLIHGRWMVGGHDGFQYFSIQYYLLNNVINYGEIPQWSPFTTHGLSAIMGYIASSGILQNILFLSGSLFKDINFLSLFHAGIFLDELLLLVGVWLLGRRFFASAFTVFFVTLSIMGSCIWMLQPWWNFHFYYAIPLILYLVHTFMDTGEWRYYFLAGNLLFIQCLGNLPYFLPVTSLVIFLYFLFYFMLNYKNTWPKIKALHFGWSFVLTTSLIIVSFVALYATMNTGANQIINYSPMRNLDGTTTLDGFLTYGGTLIWRVWLEMILGISPCLDYNLYIGILCVPFIVLALISNINKQNGHFLLTIIILLLFGMGTSISVFFYYCWPMMKLYRHLIPISTFIKIFLCFLAGFGFDAMFFNKSRWKNPFVMRVSLAMISVLMLGLSLFLWLLANNYEFSSHLIKSMASGTLPLFTTIFHEEVMTSMLNHTTLFVLTASIIFAVSSFIKRKQYFIYLIILVSALHCADIYGFKISEIRLKAVPLNNELYKITAFQPIPYAKRRDVSFEINNPRAALLKVLPIQAPGVFYSSTDAFLFKDELGNHFRNDYWSLPLDNYMRAYWGQSNYESSINPLALSFGHGLEFPQGHPAALKISGVTEDKIQFFSQINAASSENVIASKITNAIYKGDIIFISPLEKNKKVSSVNHSEFSENNLSSNQRLHLPYQVQRFDSNNIEITTDVNYLKSAWLLYSDIWHPLWRATVNGQETPVYKANLAYKAVRLEPGLNKIHFYFKSRLMSVLFLIYGLNALCWLIIIIYLITKVALTNPRKSLNG